MLALYVLILFYGKKNRGISFLDKSISPHLSHVETKASGLELDYQIHRATLAKWYDSIQGTHSRNQRADGWEIWIFARMHPPTPPLLLRIFRSLLLGCLYRQMIMMYRTFIRLNCLKRLETTQSFAMIECKTQPLAHSKSTIEFSEGTSKIHYSVPLLADE